MALSYSTPSADFVVEPPTLEISSGWKEHAGPAASAGGVLEGRGCRRGHQVCWRVSGTSLELAETCLLPGVTLAGAELRIQFPSNLLPPLGLFQLPNDSLLVSAAMHAPSGGVFVYQLVFDRPAAYDSAAASDPPRDAPLVLDAVVSRASWFASPPSGAPNAEVGASLGTPLSAAFAFEAMDGARAVRTSLLLGGESPHPIHVTIAHSGGTTPLVASEYELREDRTGRVLTSLLGRAAGSIGLSVARPNASPAHEFVSSVAFLRNPAALCALTLTRGGTLRLWPLQPGGVDAAASASPPPLAASVCLASRLSTAPDGRSEIHGSALIAICVEGDAGTAVAVGLGGEVLTLGPQLPASTSALAALVGRPDQWRSLGAPGNLQPAAALLKLALRPRP